MAQVIKNHLQCGRPGFDPWVGEIPWRREKLPTPVFWPGEVHGLSPRGCKESDATERLSLSFQYCQVWSIWELLRNADSQAPPTLKPAASDSVLTSSPNRVTNGLGLNRTGGFPGTGDF